MAILHGDYTPLRGIDPGERVRRAVAEAVARRAGLFPGDLALVAPAGAGLAAAPLARAFTRCRVVAVEEEADGLARCVENARLLGAAERLRPYRASATGLPFVDEAFPLVVSVFELHAHEDPLGVLEELHRVAFWSGKLLAVEPDFSRLGRRPSGTSQRSVFDADTLAAVKAMGWGKVAVQRLDTLPDGTVVQMLAAKRLDPDEE